MSKKLPIIIIGPYPPNVGGVSTHIFRALSLLIKDGFDVTVFSVNPIKALREKNVRYVSAYVLPFLLLFRRKSAFHFHVDSVNHLILAKLMSLRHSTYLTIHNNRYPTTLHFKSLTDKLKWHCLASFKNIICVNSETQVFLKQRLSNVYDQVIPAYLPPSQINTRSIDEIKKWGDKFDYVLSGYAYRLSFYKNTDLYGIDLMIQLMSKLVEDKIKIGLVLLLNLEENAYLTELKKEIQGLGVEKYIKLIDIKDGIDAVALWQYSDVYLRPTNTDGNSISVLEALSVGTPVVASDCVERPASCLLFKNRDINDFTKKVKEGLTYKVSKIEDYGLFKGY